MSTNRTLCLASRGVRPLGLTAALMVILALFQPGAAQACAVCYGDPSSPASIGLTWAITALGVLVVLVLTGVVGFFVHMNRKAAALERAQPGEWSMENC